MAAPPQLYVKAVTDIENFEKGKNFRATKKISDPARLEDFAQFVIPPDDLEDLKDCRVGDCEIKLGRTSLERIRQGVDWSKPTAATDLNLVLRKLALEYVNAYREGGNARLAGISGPAGPTFVAKEFDPWSSECRN